MQDIEVQISPESWDWICEHGDAYVEFVGMVEDSDAPEVVMAWLDERGVEGHVQR